MSGVVQFYDNHPINIDQILQILQFNGVSIETLTEEDLKEYDSDHYGGYKATDLLGQKAQLTKDDYVLDVGSGLGGPARYLAHRFGCRVTGLDITESRCRGAEKLTQLVILQHLVDFRVGDAYHMPFGDAVFSAVIGQEAWSHIDDKERLISECARVLRPNGTLAFTDIIEIDTLSETEREFLRTQAHMPSFGTLEGYTKTIERNCLSIIEREELSKEWFIILAQRVDMYKNLKAETIEKFGESHYEKFIKMYTFFSSLFTSGKLGGARFIAKKLT
jgi:sarcosine/dimethylglycine N-methyltransferase